MLWSLHNPGASRRAVVTIKVPSQLAQGGQHRRVSTVQCKARWFSGDARDRDIDLHELHGSICRHHRGTTLSSREQPAHAPPVSRLPQCPAERAQQRPLRSKRLRTLRASATSVWSYHERIAAPRDAARTDCPIASGNLCRLRCHNKRTLRTPTRPARVLP